MFKKTLNFSQLKTDVSEISDLKGSEVIQVLHRGHEIKVIMTQEYFFLLQARAEANETAPKRTSHNKELLKEKFQKSKKALEDRIREG